MLSRKNIVYVRCTYLYVHKSLRFRRHKIDNNFSTDIVLLFCSSIYIYIYEMVSRSERNLFSFFYCAVYLAISCLFLCVCQWRIIEQHLVLTRAGPFRILLHLLGFSMKSRTIFFCSSFSELKNPKKSLPRSTVNPPLGYALGSLAFSSHSRYDLTCAFNAD